MSATTLRSFLRERTPLPVRMLIRRLRILAHRVRHAVVEEGLLNGLRARLTQPQPGVLLVGYIEAELGLGQSLRGLASSLHAAGVPFGLYPFNVNVSHKRFGLWHPEWYDHRHRYKATLIEMSADQQSIARRIISPGYLKDSYLILRTFWELPKAPDTWKEYLSGVDELWVPNPYVAGAFRDIFDGRIEIVPVCVDVKAEDAGVYDGIDGNRFNFLFSFDYNSSPHRKNPTGLVDAFQRAFPPDRSDVGLLLKTNGDRSAYPDVAAALDAAAKRDPRIRIIDGPVTRAQMLALIATVDCYISLHRAEGFGLGMAEAMALGKPVIGTDFSGNTEFLREDTGFPVRYRLAAVEEGAYHLADGMYWADPDLDHAAELMARVVSDRETTAARAQTGQAFMLANHSLDAVGDVARRRLAQIQALETA